MRAEVRADLLSLHLCFVLSDMYSSNWSWWYLFLFKGVTHDGSPGQKCTHFCMDSSTFAAILTSLEHENRYKLPVKTTLIFLVFQLHFHKSSDCCFFTLQEHMKTSFFYYLHLSLFIEKII